MHVHQLKVAAALGALAALSAAAYADEATDQANPDTRALLEYVKKLENRVNDLERERQWGLDSVRAQSASALESAVRAINLSGYMEFQYGYNWEHGGTAPGRGDTLGFNQLRGTDANENGFSFQNLQLLADKPLGAMGSTGFRVRSEYGLVSEFDNRDATFDGSGAAFSVREAYFNWRCCEFVDLAIGKFDTPFTFENPDNTDNWLVTRTPMYVYGAPLTHTGLRATMPIYECTTFDFYVVNGWDNVNDSADGKTVIGSLKLGQFEALNSSIRFNASYGHEGSLPVPSTFGTSAIPTDGNKTQLYEAIWEGRLGDNTGFALDGMWGSQDKGAVAADDAGDGRENLNWAGIQGFVKHSFNKGLYLAGGLGYYGTNAPPTGTDFRLWSVQVVLGYNIATDATVALEYRHDMADTGDPYLDDAGNADDKQDTFTASFVYRF